MFLAILGPSTLIAGHCCLEDRGVIEREAEM
jgi:hypothetical protein